MTIIAAAPPVKTTSRTPRGEAVPVMHRPFAPSR